MKIGIVTYHRTQNFGAALQAVATRFVLEKLGHDAFYIDYWPSYHKAKYSVFPFHELKGKYFRDKVLFVLYELTYRLIPRIKRKRSFDKFLANYIYPYCIAINEQVDVVVYGSDQIWRKQSTGGYNPFYFGENDIPASRHVAYAASAGVLPTSAEDKRLFKNLVSNLDEITVRENDLAELLTELGFRGVRHVLDPTLLLKREQWDSFLSEEDVKTKYVLVYSPSSSSCFDVNEVRMFAERRGLTLIELKGEAFVERGGLVANCGPSQFISLIKNAEYVFSSSFHGVAFSIIYQKQFYASFKHNSARVGSLLHLLDIDDRMVAPYCSIRELSNIDYALVEARLDVLRRASIECLNNML